MRFSRPESRRLALALGLSLLAHLLVWGGYEFGKTLNLWQRLHFPPLTLFAKFKPVRPAAQTVPIVFVDVSPAQATDKAPKNTKYFGVRNSRAANPEANRDTKVPEFKGTQTEIVKTENTPRPFFSKAPPAPQPPPKPQPRLAVNSGDLTLGQPQPLQPEEQPLPRPRTLQQALAMQNQLPGQMMKQEGGVRRHAIAPSLDVKVTGFSDYDRRFVEAVTQHWYDLLDSQRFALDRTGKVVLRFRLNWDGSISDMRIAENTVGDLLGYVCQKAVLDNAPFERWTTNMRLELGDHCNVQFTFYYTN